MSLNAILPDNNILNSKIQDDVNILSRLKIVTNIFLEYIMNKPDCRLSKLYAIEGIQFDKIIGSFKKKTKKAEETFKKNYKELNELFEEFKTLIKDEETEIDSELLMEFKKLYEGKADWIDENEEYDAFHEYRMEKLTKFDCYLRNDLILQACQEMRKDLDVHLHIEKPKILKKYFNIILSEKKNLKDGKEDYNTDNLKNKVECGEKKEKNSKNKRRLRNRCKKVEKKLEAKRRQEETDKKKEDGINNLTRQKLRQKNLSIQFQSRKANRNKDLNKINEDYEKKKVYAKEEEEEDEQNKTEATDKISGPPVNGSQKNLNIEEKSKFKKFKSETKSKSLTAKERKEKVEELVEK